MSSSGSSPPGNNRAPKVDEKTRLTEEEKKLNHIASEHKRREAIRAGFDRLCEIVPGLEGQGRSEGHVLRQTIIFIEEQLNTRRELIAQARAKGIQPTEADLQYMRVLEKLEARARDQSMNPPEPKGKGKKIAKHQHQHDGNGE
ncbi:hypothetical protein F5Y16DRAFT_40866 [Xylariaceae sp. FL0255]|nr:hypothetical protein F5Y16DRAFT_40866 [Xylariaceae sp. FL0255]